MKKFLCTLSLSFCFVTNIYGSNHLDLLNTEIETILVPIQNELTVAKLKFDTVEIDKDRASKVALNGLYHKMGSKNFFELKVDNLSYDYGDGTSPTTVIKGSIGLDLTTFLTREESNVFIPGFIELVGDIVNNYTIEYGDAVFVKGVITSTTKDDEGNYSGVTALIATKIDLDKLPENLSRDSVMAIEAVFSVTLNLKTGIGLDAFVVSNPEYSGFQENQMGLKEMLELLLERDEDAKSFIISTFMVLDTIASEVVEIDNASFWKWISKTLPSFKIKRSK